MNRLGFFGIILLSLYAPTLSAAPKQNIEKLMNSVFNAATEHYKASFGQEMFNNNVQIQVGSLDRRLQLAQCDDNLTFKIKEPPHNAHNVTVKATCNNQHRWTIYVPVTVNVYANVLTTRVGLRKGDVLTPEQLSYKRVNIAALGHGPIEDIERAAGMLLKRPLKSGAILRYSYLEKPTIVHKGQKVVLASRSDFLSVETTGVALGNGHLGQSIKVKNPNSNRVLEAQVVAPGKVMVATR